MDSGINKQEKTVLDPKWGEKSAFHDPYVLANFKPRDTDVLITTAPKAGTTWMQQIMYQLKTAGESSFSSIFEVIPWLEYPGETLTSRQRLDVFEAVTEPRVFKTHCTYSQTPGVNQVRIVLSSRDPRDCCVSFYHHIMSMTETALALHGMQAPVSFDSYFEQWMKFDSWFRNVESWWPHVNDENVLWLRYEDMVNDLEQSIDRLLSFLQWTLTSAQKRDVLEYSSFSWMKKNADKFRPRFDNGEAMFKPDGFIRKGQVGDYKNLIKPEQEQFIIEQARLRLTADCLQYLGIDEFVWIN